MVLRACGLRVRRVLEQDDRALRIVDVLPDDRVGDVSLAQCVRPAHEAGINKDGFELYRVGADGERSDEIDDGAIEDVRALLRGEDGPTSRFAGAAGLEFPGVPKYSDPLPRERFEGLVAERHPGFSVATVRELVERGMVEVRAGHGSPSLDLRFGDVPYIKVSDLRAGLVNVNRTNLVPLAVARRFWRGETSGLEPFDVLTPARACKNIGEPVVLLPDQTEVVLTKEMLVFRPGEKAVFGPFYLAWALDLELVRAQWDRVTFMQTNREDVGSRYLEIEIPVPPSAAEAERASAHYRAYYTALAEIRSAFSEAKRADQGL